MNLTKIMEKIISSYVKYLFIGDFNSETSETALKNLCGVYKL